MQQPSPKMLAGSYGQHKISMLNLWITCCSSARWLGFFGSLLSVVWGFVGFLLKILEVIFWRGRVCLVGRWGKRARRGGCYLMSCCCFFWCIWRERNRRAFEGIEIPFHYLKDIVMKTLYFWESGKLCSSSFELFFMLDSLYMGRT